MITMTNTLFSKYCAEEWLPLIDLHKVVYSVKAKAQIFTEGEPVKGIYFIDSGFVKVTSTFGDKLERILRLSKEGTILGHRAFLSKTYPISAVALTDSELTFIPTSLFIQLMKANPNFSLYLFEFATRDLRDSEEQNRILTIPDVRQRIAFIIVKLIDSFGFKKGEKNKLAFTLSRKDFALMANTTYETIIRTLTLLENKKIIKGVGKEIVITNEAALRKLALGKE